MPAERPIFSSQPLRTVTKEVRSALDSRTNQYAQEENGQLYFFDETNLLQFPDSWTRPNKQARILPKLSLPSILLPLDAYENPHVVEEKQSAQGNLKLLPPPPISEFRRKLSSTITGYLTGKALIGTLFASEIIDLAMTKADLLLFHGQEISPFGGTELMRNLEQRDVFILKLAVSAWVVGGYTLASIHKNETDPKKKWGWAGETEPSSEKNLSWAWDRALQIATLSMAGVLTWDSVNLGLDVASNAKF